MCELFFRWYFSWGNNRLICKEKAGFAGASKDLIHVRVVRNLLYTIVLPMVTGWVSTTYVLLIGAAHAHSGANGNHDFDWLWGNGLNLRGGAQSVFL